MRSAVGRVVVWADPDRRCFRGIQAHAAREWEADLGKSCPTHEPEGPRFQR